MEKHIEDEIKLKKFSDLDITNPTDHYSKEIYKSRYDFINKSFVYGGYTSGKIIQVVAAPGAGMPLFLQNEAVNFIEQGKRVCYLTIGDLTELDLVTNFISITVQKPLKEVESDIASYFEKYKHKFDDLLKIIIVPSAESVELIKHVSWLLGRMDEEYDILMCDYGGNFLIDIRNEMLNLLTRLTKEDKLLFIGNRPKISFYNKEILFMDALVGDRLSYIQHISDLIITIGRNFGASVPCGKFNIVKNRLNEELSNVSQLYIRASEGLFYLCSEALYTRYALNNQNGILFSYDELRGLDALENNQYTC
jgi:hypothetical protein